jgi:hypothetical protein
LFALRPNSFARLVAALCVILACAFSVHATVVSLDRIEHALDHHHDANPVAGSVQDCGTGERCKESSDPHSGVSHVHIGDTVVAFALLFATFEILLRQDVTQYAVVSDQSVLSSRPTLLDPPPKA